MTEKRKWWSKILRTPSTEEREHTEQAAGHIPRHRRSVSDLALKMMHGRKEPQKRLSLQTMVRLGGKSMFYLPAEYAPGALMLPTCIRATAQYLAQHGLVTRGVFRIPGSQRIVNALFDYYCFEGQNEEVARTVRCPNLPTHINAGPHDIASAFKKFLGVLPGGILGSLGLFDALVAIHSQSRAEPEFIRTRQTKIRGRLIALAIGTLQSQFHRELVCAVFGLLSLVGRQAEIAPHEDGLGHPLPTSDLMGYSALGIIFGPLLIGDLLDTYNIRVAHPSSGLLLFPMTPTKLKKERSRSKTMVSEHSPTVDKILIANEIAEMIITHWRDVVRNLRSLSVLAGKGRSKGNSDGDLASRRGFLRSSASEPFKLKRPPGWEDHSPDMPGAGRTGSPTLDTPTPAQTSKKSGLPQSDSGLVSSRLRRFMKTDQEGWPEQGIVEPVPSRGQGRSSEESKITARQVASSARGQGEHQGIQKSTTFPKRKPVARSADVRNSSLSDRRGIIAADVEVESRSLEQRNTSGAGSNQTVRINSNMHEESVAEREKERENSMQITPKEFFKEFDVAMREPVHTDVSRTNSLEAQ
ncbi:Ankyrin repeat-containing protein P16F5.05c [Verticillium dahliae VDG2]|nr:Ankyrin repeat-containing protein P16F5.05c [Verticillium dahliae VDG2]